MPRPLLDERLTIRLPGVLLRIALERAARRNCSVNEVVLSSMESDFARMDTYVLDYYLDVIPMVENRKGDIVRQSPPMSDKN